MTNRQVDEGALAAVEHALAEVERAKREPWLLPDGSPATAALRRLEEQLTNAATILRETGTLESGRFRGIVKWVSDWIPTLDDPLVAAIAQVERATK